MNRTIYPPLHTEAHRRMKAEAVRRAHALHREAVNALMDDLGHGLRRWLGRQADWLPLARRMGA